MKPGVLALHFKPGAQLEANRNNSCSLSRALIRTDFPYFVLHHLQTPAALYALSFIGQDTDTPQGALWNLLCGLLLWINHSGGLLYVLHSGLLSIYLNWTHQGLTS